MAVLTLNGGVFTLGADTPGFFASGALSGTDDIDASGGPSLIYEGAASGVSYTYSGALTASVIVWHTDGILEIAALGLPWTGGLTVQAGSVIIDQLDPTRVATMTIYSGASLVLNGDMQGAGAINHSISLNGSSGTATLSDGGHTVELRKGISATGAVSLAITGGGTTIFAATNSYSGATDITAGTTLKIGNGGTSGTLGTGSVTDAGSLVFNRSNTLTAANNISGTGTLAQEGTGTAILTGANSYSGATTISAGTLQIGNGGTTGTLGSGAIVDNAILAFNRSDVLTLSTTISGTGKIIQSGAGTVRLTLASTYSGGTEIASGTLDVATAGATGTGQIAFQAGAQTLALETAAFTAGDFVNALFGFGAEDTIDLVGLSASSASLGPGNVLNVTTPGGMRTLHLDPAQSFGGKIFQTSSDGAGGTFLKLVAAPLLAPTNPWTVNESGGHDITVTAPGALSASNATTNIDLLIYSTMQPLTLPSGIENIVLGGGGGRNFIVGNEIDNRITITSGDWNIDGLAANDTVVFARDRASYIITLNDNQITVIGPEGTQTLSNIETLHFADKALTFDRSADASLVFGLYQAGLGRSADPVGMGYWLDWLHGGKSSHDLANLFIDSAEFRTAYGATTNDSAYITALYQNVLHRPADDAGVGFWTGRLAHDNRAQLLVDFASSIENQNSIKAIIGQGVQVEHALM